ncbi:protein MEMO1 homolog isoform X2 [Hylaeus volcanicus]|uniref:protein MEMO1 homolog isoform X2 n=1 Tax=Hylaeus volcanicus TaxID=313075 RepID=UPI0023B794E0|nr:protein MEMO1 homolog isoform X2 [Hylaeus volcanicus]
MQGTVIKTLPNQNKANFYTFFFTMNPILEESVRRATHAGSWYPSCPITLTKNLEDYLNKAESNDFTNVKAIISPHAGYSYCGDTASYAWKSLTFLQQPIKQVVIIAPSHYCQFQGFKVPFAKCQFYATPLGLFELDTLALDTLAVELNATYLTKEEDEEEHSVEMMLPFLYIQLNNMLKKKTKEIDTGRNSSSHIEQMKKEKKSLPKLIPLLVGSVMDVTPLLKYFNDPECLFVISSDFCHWGKRFHYMYTPKPLHEKEETINALIQRLDMEAITCICNHNIDDFEKHLRITRNTICGANALIILLHLIQKSNMSLKTNVLHYSQSSLITNPTRNTSVSYASLLTFTQI